VDWQTLVNLPLSEHQFFASVPAQKSAIKIGGLLIVMPAKAGIQVREFSGFRVAPGLRRGCPEWRM